MASLGNLFFEILYRDDPKQLEEIKKRALAQLKEIEVNLNFKSNISKEDISKQIDEAIAKERKVNVTVDKETLSKDVSEAVSGGGGADAYRDMESAINSVIGTRNQNIKRLLMERDALKGVQSQLKLYEKQQSQGIALTKDQIANKANLINREHEHKQAISELTQLIKADIKASQSANSSMKELSVTLNRMKTAYRELNKEARESPFGRELKTQIGALDKEMKALDAGIGNHQRNVGNYKQVFNGLQFQVQQVARELPSIAYGANIFFAAISNNIPMLNDEIRRAKLEYKALLEEQANGINLNKKAVPVWKQMMQSIFSWQTALVAVLTILTLYGAKIVDAIGNMLKFRDAAKLTRKEIKKMGEDFAEVASREISQLDTLFDRLEKAKEGTTEWHDARAQILSQHGETLNKLSTEIQSLNDKAGAYRSLRDEIYATAKAEAVSKATQELQTKAVDKAITGYAKIYEEAVSKKGETYADDLINRIRTDIETVGKLSDELSREIENTFSYEAPTFIGTSTSGAPQIGTAIVNNVKDALDGILKAEQDYQNKRSQAEGVFSWLNISDKEIIEDESYWKAQKDALEKRLKGMTREQAMSQEGRDLKLEILKIEKLLKDAYTIDGSKTSKTDEYNKSLRERIKLLLEANSMYKDWTSLIGEEKAIGVVQSIIPDFNPDTFRSQLEDILSKGNKETKIEAAKALTGLDKDTINKTLEDVKKEISDTVKKWDLFSELFKTTGDYNFSVNAAFGGDIGFKSVLDELKSNIEKELSKSDTGLNFKDVIKLGSKGTEQIFGAEMANYVEEYIKQSEKLSDESLKRTANLLSTYKNYEQQRKDIIAKGEQDIADLIANGASQDAIEEATKRMNESLASLDFKEFKESGEWAMVFDDLDRYATNALDSVMVKLEEFANTTGKDLPINEFKELVNAIKKLRGEVESRNPFKALAEGVKEYLKASKNDDPAAKADAQAAAIGKIKNAFNEATPALQTFSSAFGELSSMFDSLGNEGMANAMDNVQMALGSVTNIGEGFAKGGIVGGIGAAIGEAAKWVGKLAGDHDEKLDKAIQKSQIEVQKLQGFYENIERSLKRSLGNVNNLYRRQKQLLEQQKKELEKQKKAEESKKKSDKSKVEDYKKEIDEINDQVKYFAEDLANDLYGIDLKGWAAQLGDALFDAWKKGESGAEAFEKTAAEILGNVMNDVLKISILEPMMNDVRTALFGSDGKGGYFGSDYSLDTNEMSQLAQILMKGEKKSEAYYEALDGLNDYMEKNYGVSLKDKKSKKGLSAGIKGITEDTADILASLVNSIRADQARTVEAITRYVNDFAPEMNTIVKAQLERLINIAENTKKSADLTEEIRDLFSAVVSGTKQVKIK